MKHVTAVLAGALRRYNFKWGSEECIHLNLLQNEPQQNLFILLNGKRETRCQSIRRRAPQRCSFDPIDSVPVCVCVYDCVSTERYIGIVGDKHLKRIKKITKWNWKGRNDLYLYSIHTAFAAAPAFCEELPYQKRIKNWQEKNPLKSRQFNFLCKHFVIIRFDFLSTSLSLSFSLTLSLCQHWRPTTISTSPSSLLLVSCVFIVNDFK